MFIRFTLAAVDIIFCAPNIRKQLFMYWNVGFVNAVYLVPSDDPHLSEYVPAAYMRRGYLTDFHGSAGTAVVTKEKAYLWTDSR